MQARRLLVHIFRAQCRLHICNQRVCPRIGSAWEGIWRWPDRSLKLSLLWRAGRSRGRRDRWPVTLEPDDGHTCWGVAYRVSGHEAEEIALSYLEVREKEYDQKAYLDFYFDEDSTEPAISGVLVYIASADKKLNKNYLGPAPLEMMAHQIVGAVGPSGPNIEYLFQLETALLEIGCKDSHVTDLANAVRKDLTCKHGDATSNGVAK